jgi:hypothetical protein
LGGTILFGKPYCWAQGADGKLSLWPALKTSQPRPHDAPFTSDLAKAAVRRLA